MGDLAVVADREVDVAALVAALEGPVLHTRVDLGDLVDALVDEVVAGMEGILPDAAAAHRNEHRLDLAEGLLLGDVCAAVDRLAGIRHEGRHDVAVDCRLDHAYVARLDGASDVLAGERLLLVGGLDRLVDGHIPQEVVQRVPARRQHGRLRTLAALALGEEERGVEHVALHLDILAVGSLGRQRDELAVGSLGHHGDDPESPRFGCDLAFVHLQTVTRIEQRVMAVGDVQHLVIGDVIEDVHQERELEARHDDLGLTAAFARQGHVASVCDLLAEVDADELRELASARVHG